MLAIFLNMVLITATWAYVNAQMPFLLQDPDYFNLPFSKTGAAAGLVLFWGMFASVLLSPLFGTAYDVLGRKWIMITASFLAVASIVLLPLTAPLFWLLCLVRVVIAVSARFVHVNPLIIDYFKSESRGLAFALSEASGILGQMLMITLFWSTRGLTLFQQYWVPTIVLGILIVPLFFLIREPTLKVKQMKNEEDMPLSFSERTAIVVSEVWKESIRRPKYILSFLTMMSCRLFVTLFSIYLQLWVISFEKSGVLASKEEADRVYRNYVFVSQTTALVFLPVYGYYSDKLNALVIILGAGLVRIAITASFRFILLPDSWYAYSMLTILTLVSNMQAVSIMALFLRNMDPKIRGSLMGFMYFLGSLG